MWGAIAVRLPQFTSEDTILAQDLKIVGRGVAQGLSKIQSKSGPWPGSYILCPDCKPKQITFFLLLFFLCFETCMILIARALKCHEYGLVDFLFFFN